MCYGALRWGAAYHEFLDKRRQEVSQEVGRKHKAPSGARRHALALRKNGVEDCVPQTASLTATADGLGSDSVVSFVTVDPCTVSS